MKQYAVSNGTIAAQELKLRNSGLGKLFDGVFLSERLGCEKPAQASLSEYLRPSDPWTRSASS